MERAPTYQVEGQVRLLAGFTALELFILGGFLFGGYMIVSDFTRETQNVVAKILTDITGTLAALGMGFGVVQLQRLAKRRLPDKWFKHFRVWLTQPDVYVPLADPDPRPLVIAPEPISHVTVVKAVQEKREAA